MGPLNEEVADIIRYQTKRLVTFAQKLVA